MKNWEWRQTEEQMDVHENECIAQSVRRFGYVP